MSSPSEEPQEARGAPGSRDTGSDQPSGGPADRPSGTYEGDTTVPSYGAEGVSAGKDSTGEMPPQEAEPAVPPYEGRQTSAATGTSADHAGDARTGGASGPRTE
ncbi:MAG: hypothetical protein ACM4D3_20130 [Candidatus Sericytochromatia bacterium]